MTPEKERARLEALLAPYDQGPALLRLYFPLKPREPLTWLLHRLVVSRVNPHYDAAGQIKNTDFWVSFLPAFYPESSSFVGRGHLLKVTEIQSLDTYLLELKGRAGGDDCRAELELIDADFYPREVEQWRRWRATVEADPEAMAERDARDLGFLRGEADKED